MRRLFVSACVLGALALPATAGAGNAPGQTIQDSCGVSFGALVSAGKSSGSAAHQNYAGGARAFSAPAILAAHGCAV